MELTPWKCPSATYTMEVTYRGTYTMEVERTPTYTWKLPHELTPVT